MYFLIGRDRICTGAIGDAALEGNTHRKFRSKLMPKEISENYWHLKQKFSPSLQKNNRCLNVSGKEGRRLLVCFLSKMSVRRLQLIMFCLDLLLFSRRRNRGWWE